MTYYAERKSILNGQTQPINVETLTRKFADGIAICNGRPQDLIDSEDYFGEHTPEPDYFDE